MQQLRSTNIAQAPRLNVALQRCAMVSLIALLVWCVVWEIWFAPLRPGGTLLFLKALPLAFAVRGVAKGSLYTIQWASMILLSSVFFFCSIFYVRPAKRAAKLAAAAEKAASVSPPTDPLEERGR
jgi:uncharacterized membrane protein